MHNPPADYPMIGKFKREMWTITWVNILGKSRISDQSGEMALFAYRIFHVLSPGYLMRRPSDGPSMANATLPFPIAVSTSSHINCERRNFRTAFCSTAFMVHGVKRICDPIRYSATPVVVFFHHLLAGCSPASNSIYFHLGHYVEDIWDWRRR